MMQRLFLALLLSTAAVAHADDQDVIDYRRHIMHTMGEQVAMLDMILQQRAPATGLATHAQILAITASTAKKAFEPKIAGGEAKPEVWAQWPDFSKRLDELVAVTDELAKTAKGGNVTATAPKLKELTCKACHDTYRQPKKK
jgi:cytochrome c556